MTNGFVIGSGFSACVNPADYNQELGEKYAIERALADAENNLWQCEGYARAMLYTAQLSKDSLSENQCPNPCTVKTLVQQSGYDKTVHVE